VLATGNQTEFGLTVAAIPVVLVLLVFAGVAVRREIKWLMSLSLVLMLASESYFSACLPRVCARPADAPQSTSSCASSSPGPTRSTRRRARRSPSSVRVSPGPHPHPHPHADPARAAILAFLILFGTFAVGLRCFADFDKGLLNAKRATVAPPQKGTPGPGAFAGGASASDRQSYFAGGQPLQPRMSIE
jgi:hypothetical protein